MIIDDHKVESHGLAARNVVKPADRVDGIWLHLSPIHCKTLFHCRCAINLQEPYTCRADSVCGDPTRKPPLLAHPITRRIIQKIDAKLSDYRAILQYRHLGEGSMDVHATNQFDNLGLAAVSMKAVQLQLSGPSPLHHLPDSCLRWLVVAAR
ncbi:hypothetical protein MTR72_21355 [Bradyrhizobium sp. ISRA442]|uniref:hypothetical protein n=1 Tax=Bradyrhizobium sp. ISRA442 TaxID=2866197 RepID=UPI00311B2875